MLYVGGEVTPVAGRDVGGWRAGPPRGLRVHGLRALLLTCALRLQIGHPVCMDADYKVNETLRACVLMERAEV